MLDESCGPVVAPPLPELAQINAAPAVVAAPAPTPASSPTAPPGAGGAPDSGSGGGGSGTGAIVGGVVGGVVGGLAVAGATAALLLHARQRHRKRNAVATAQRHGSADKMPLSPFWAEVSPHVGRDCSYSRGHLQAGKGLCW